MNKKIIISLLLLVFLCAFATSALALTGSSITKNKDLGTADTKMSNIGSTILSAVTNVGVVVSVIALAAIGVKYMLGSAEDKAEYKKSMMPYLIGTALLFGASTIAKIVVTIAKNIKV